MKNIIRIFSLLLALLMVASCLVACKGDKNEGGEGGGQTQAGGTVATVESEYVSKLPEEMDWGGEEYLVLGQNTTANPAWYTFEIARTELPDDVVGKAVWERNDAIKNKYNFVVTEELVSQSYSHVQSYYTTNEDKYDMVMYQIEGLFPHIKDGYLHDLTTVSYVDFDHPTWNDYTNEQLTLGSATYAVNSHFNLQNKAQLYALLYNREMARDAGDGYLEDLVVNNQWTIDKYSELIKTYAEDTGGNGTKGDYEEDTFGIVGDKWSFLIYSTGAGYRASKVVDGKAQLVGAGQNVLDILEKVGEFFFESQSSFITESIPPLDYGRSGKIYKEGRSLIAVGSIAGYDPELTFEQGILPCPKFDANQENYYSQVNPKYSSLCAIPMTVVDTEFAGFGLEVLAEYSTDTTYEAYIETKCKLQDSYDQRMSDMFEIVFQNPVYDMVIAGNFGSFRDIMMSRVPDSRNASRYSNFYKQNYEKAEDSINDIMEKLGIVVE